MRRLTVDDDDDDLIRLDEDRDDDMGEKASQERRSAMTRIRTPPSCARREITAIVFVVV